MALRIERTEPSEHCETSLWAHHLATVIETATGSLPRSIWIQEENFRFCRYYAGLLQDKHGTKPGDELIVFLDYPRDDEYSFGPAYFRLTNGRVRSGNYGPLRAGMTAPEVWRAFRALPPK